MITMPSTRAPRPAKGAGKSSTPPPKAASRKAPPAPADSDEDQYFSRAVGKAFFILRILNQSEAPAALSEMASRAGLTKTSCFRLLHTLERLGYVAQSADGRYSAAEKHWGSSSTQVANALLRGPQNVARALSEESGESVSIAVLFTNHIEVVQSFESSRVLRMANTVGRILPPHASSLGKAIAAFQPEAVCRKLLVSYGLQRYTDYTITDESALREEFEKIRKQGYAFEREESTWDGCCYGTPVFVDGGKRQGPVVAAISLSMPKSRVPVTAPENARTVEMLRAAAGQVSEYLRSVLVDQA